MESYRTEIIYDGIVVGYRTYKNNSFVGYIWLEKNYQIYEMYIAKQKLT